MKLKRIFYKTVNPFRRLYWRIFRPRTYGVKCLVENGGKYLLIRNSYGKHGWTFPGGGIKRHELPEDAAKREVKEELGIELSDVEKIGEYESRLEYKRDIVYCFHAKVSGDQIIRKSDEVSEAEWFAPDKIPEFQSSAVGKMLKML